MNTATKGFVSRHVLAPFKAAMETAQRDLLSWAESPPPKYSEKPKTNELLSMLDPLAASSNQMPSPSATKCGSVGDLKSTGLADGDPFLSPSVSFPQNSSVLIDTGSRTIDRFHNLCICAKP